MDYLSNIKAFLASKISDQENCRLCFIFGSIAKGSANPNDCDLFWLTSSSPETENWSLLQKRISSVKKEFLEKFNLPLNIFIYTLEEYNENSEFKKRIFERSKIIIKTVYNTV